MTEVLMPVVFMFILCTVHSQIVSTNSGPTLSTSINRSRVRRSRHERSRSGKLRSRRNPRSVVDVKTSQENVCENVKKVYSNVLPSVRFAKKLCIDTKLIPGSKVQVCFL